VPAEGFACAESPRWHDGELYFSGVYGRAVIVGQAYAVRALGGRAAPQGRRGDG
jgi:hypothetical protein